ncbi:MAG: alginate export family protein [SAR324 cluster bacterium]|nr:alginate export family protein [SAR324 cluster bacterium]
MSSKLFRLILVVYMAGLLVPTVDAEPLLDALKNGEPSLNLRWSYETADLEGGTKAASGLILRTRLGYRTAPFWSQTTAFLHFQDVRPTGLQDYAPEDADFDTIADPTGTAVYEGYLENKALPDTQVRLGRQEIILDNHRLVGNIGWRQHNQSFDAVLVTNDSLADLKFIVGRVWRVKTIFNTEVDLEHFVILETVYEGIEEHRLSFYNFLLDSRGGTDSDRDLSTLGARITGSGGPVSYEADYSAQSGYADNSSDGGTMLNGFVSATVVGVKLGVGYGEISGATNSARAFDTLFSTAHAFNGWADQFPATNGGNLTNGLKDTYLHVDGTVAGYKLLARFHQFQQESESDNYGSELDLLVATKLAENLKGLIKYAGYVADSGNDLGDNTASNKTLTWVRLEYNF